MKVSETAIPKPSRKEAGKSCDLKSNGSSLKDSSSIRPVKTVSKNTTVLSGCIPVKKSKVADTTKGGDGLGSTGTKASVPGSVVNAKKPWIPCTRRPSRPKLPPAILEMELSLVDPDKICKKYPKSPSSDSSDNDKNHRRFANKPNTFRSPPISPVPSERRNKVILKRQFALDKAVSNSNESVSDESLNSITSVTQLLKIERCAYTANNNTKTDADVDAEQDIVFAGVKKLAARLQARTQIPNITTNRTVGSCDTNTKGNCINSDDSSFQARSSQLAIQNMANAEKKENLILETEEGNVNVKMGVKCTTSVSSNSTNSETTPTAAAPERKSTTRANTKVSPATSSSNARLALSTVTEAKVGSGSIAEKFKASTTPQPLKSSSSVTKTPTPSISESDSRSSTETIKKTKQSFVRASNKKQSNSTNVTVGAISLAKQTNQIKDQQANEFKSRVNTSYSDLNSFSPAGGQRTDVVAGNTFAEKRSFGKDDDRSVFVLRYAPAKASTSTAALSGSGARQSKSSTGKSTASTGKCKVERIKATCKFDALNKSKKSHCEEVEESSLSSSSSSSPTWRSEHQQERIIPAIIMSEYVENEDGKGTTVVANSQSLFIPLQFIETLEPTCDVLEGSSLELKVRIQGAETVVWVKENKIIPNIPPDFEYFEGKADGVFKLKIADVFLEDAGLYVCEAYGAGGSEITCWCEVEVIDANPNDDDDISWEDLDMSEEVKSSQPLVVPVIVTSQAEQDTYTNPCCHTVSSKEPSPIRTINVKQVDNHDPDIEDTMTDELPTQLISASRDDVCDETLHKSSADMGGDDISTQDDIIIKSKMKSHSSSELTANCIDSTTETVTEFASANAIKETRYTYPEAMQTEAVTATTVAVVVPAEVDQLCFDTDAAAGGSHQRDTVLMTTVESQRKLLSQLSSASDESISLKEPRSGDEGALSSAEEMSASISIDVKSSITNDEDHITSADSPACSPFSEQNGRSSSVDSAIGFLGRPLFSDGKFPPRILMGPSCVVALYGEVVHLRVKVQNYGIQKTSVNWFKFVNGTYKKIELNSGDQISSQSDAHVSITKCGTSLSTLSITQVNYDDCGRYRVKVQNSLGMDSHDCVLTVEGPPEAPTSPPKVKYDDKSKTILIQWSGCPYDGGSKIIGYYVEASIIQGSRSAINKEDQDNWQLLTPQSYSWLCYTLTSPKRGSVYRFRVLGENSYGRGKPTEPSLPLLVPVLMEGRRAGSSDALLWSLKSSLNHDELPSLRVDSKEKVVLEHENEGAQPSECASSQEEEPIVYQDVTLKHDSFYNVYDKFDELGKGRFGIVFEVVNKETKKSYAGKFVKCIKAKDKERVQLEVKIMNDLAYHPKLICLIEAFEMSREIVIVTQRINGGELFERVVADDFTLTEGDCVTFLQQICDAVKYIHEKNIMHLDLKPENILCTSKDSNRIKLIDFGLAQYHNPKEPIRVLFGTAEFVSPEIINYEPIALSTDNWSVGVITYILLSGLSPFMGDNDNETFSNITRAEFDFDDEAFEKVSDDAKDFISSLIVKRPEKRMTDEECLNHRWLKPESDNEKMGVVLPTDKLKRFLVRRKWQKTGNAIRALGRITTLYSSRRSSSASSTPTGSFSMSLSSSPSSISRTESLFTQDSTDNDNVFLSHTTTSFDSDSCKMAVSNNTNQSSRHVKLAVTKNPPLTSKPKHSDPSRSDSGVCDVGSFSSSLNSE